MLTPVRLVPGRLKLLTRPVSTGSAPVRNTIGVVLVAAFAANADGASKATITATSRASNSPTSDGKRSYRPPAQRHSMLMFLPSIKPASASPCRKVASEPGMFALGLLRNPIEAGRVFRGDAGRG